MPGVLSTVFGTDDADAGGTETQVQESTLDAQAEQDLGVDIGVGTELSGSYTGLDGTTHEWSQSNDVDIDADASFLLGTATDLVTSNGESDTQSLA